MISWHTPDKTPRETKAPPLKMVKIGENGDVPRDHPASAQPSPLNFIFAPNEPQIVNILESLLFTKFSEISPPYHIIFLDLPLWNDPELTVTPRTTTVPMRPEEAHDIPNADPSGKKYCIESISVRFSQQSTQAAYFDLIKGIILAIKPLMAPNGVVIVKSLDRCRHYLKALLDDLLGYEKFLNEVIIASPFCSNHNGARKDMTGSLFLYYRDVPPPIHPQYKAKASGGYWHSLHSEGQGTAKEFQIFENNIEKRIKITPPVGTHWKYKQDEVYRMCQAGTIKLTKNGLPVYWVKEKMGFIVDNNWLDLPSHYLDILGFLVNPQLMDRIVATFSKPSDKILHLFPGMEKSGVSCARLDRCYVGIDVYPQFQDALIRRCKVENIGVQFFQTLHSQTKSPFNPHIASKNALNSDSNPSSSPNAVFFTPELQSKSLGEWSVQCVEHYCTPNSPGNEPMKMPPKDHLLGNRLYWGDNLYALTHLLRECPSSFQLIYIDPPFFTGVDEVINIPVSPTAAPVKDIAYQNTLDLKNPSAAIYIFSQWLYERVVLMRDLLKDTGFLALRLDYHFGYYAKIVLDRVFGASNFMGELLVRRMTKNLSDKALHTQNKLIVQNDSIFLYRKTTQAQFCNPIMKVKRLKGDEIETECAEDNIWLDIDGYEKKKRTLYPTENSKALLERIITMCTSPGDLVGDFFAGSGTTLYTAALMNRMWMGADIGYYAINEIRKLMLTDPRLQKIWQQKAFQVLNIGSFAVHDSISATESSLRVTLTPSPHRMITLQIDQFICSTSLLTESSADTPSSSLDLLDFIAIDWDYQADHGFIVEEFSMRVIYTKGPKALRTKITPTFTHQYSHLGPYTIGFVIVDIFGHKNMQFLKVTLL